MDKDEFLKRLISTFRVEAREHISALSTGLVALEEAADPEERARITESVFREAHSLKGAARSVNLSDIERICQSLESVLSALKKAEIFATRDLFDVLHHAVDAVAGLVSSDERNAPAVNRDLVRETIRSLDNAAAVSGSGQAAPEAQSLPPVPAAPAHETPETVRISFERLSAIMLQTEELLSVRLAAEQRSADVQKINSCLAEWGREWRRRVSEPGLSGARRAEGARLKDLAGWVDNFIVTLGKRLDVLKSAAFHDAHAISLMAGNLLEDMKNALMLPFSSVLELLPKAVRDLSRARDKEVDLVMHGAEIEMDRRILEEIKDPLLHLVRNCIDHGIEKCESRNLAGKPVRGTITITVSQTESKKVELVVADDGAGIDLDKVKASAVRLGLLSTDEARTMDAQQALLLVFQSGVSTNPIITDISGRGLGLAIVQEKVCKLGGTVSCETQHSGGTIFRITLPLSLATYRGALVRTTDRFFIIPTANIERVLRIRKEEIKTVENRETVMFGGYAIPYVPLHAVLELPLPAVSKEEGEFALAAVLNAAEKLVAFGVDEVLGEQDILVKSMGRQLSRVRNVAGATVLGTGKAVPILNVADLIKSAVRSSPAASRPVAVAAETRKERRKVLVAEDSITARTLLKSILESAGYEVVASVDGVDAFTALKTSNFDLVVSDVDMPRMSGFDLTAKIRGDKNLAEIPVVLVTALESREDRERGIDVGANAYIVKSSFDQSNLLEVIGRLI